MKSQPPAPHRPPVHSSRWRRWARFLLLCLMAGSLLVTITIAVTLGVYSHLAKQYDLSKLGEMPERTVVLDAQGEMLGRMHGENRIVVPLSQVSPFFVKALLAREDSRFYDHGGIDYVGVARAAVRNIKDRRVVQGASTITMQLARNSYPDLNDRSFHRKMLEMMLARRIEGYWTKDQILEHYVNRIFFGTNLYGIQRASQVYFGKHASQLNMSEAALIAGIIRSPVRFSPFRNFDGALKERDDVLKRMLATKVITTEEELAARYADIALHAQPAFQSQGGYALDAVRRDLDRVLEDHEIEDGGLIVYTTLSQELQTLAEQSVEKRLAVVEKLPGYKHPTKAAFDATWDGTQEVASTPYLQGAVTILDNATGGILALVGGRDYRQSKYNRATQGQRQIGSTVKPFVYATAIASGFLPGTFIDDAPIQPGEIEGAGAGWSPQNSDGKFTGQQTLMTGLVQSRNTMTIRVGNYAGLDRVLHLLGDAGIGNSAERTPQIFIGNLGGTPRDLTSAFSIFPNDGIRRRPFLIDKVTDKAGNILYSTSLLEADVVSPGVAHLMRRILGQVMDRGTAASVRSEHKFKDPAGGKTGTTNDYKDAWFAGYTDRVTCAVWVGLDKPQTIVDQGYGSRLAIPIWADVVKKAVELGYIPAGPRVEPPLAAVQLCHLSSQLATPACHASGTAYDEKLPYDLIPQGNCGAHQGVIASPQYEDRPRDRSPGLFNRIRGWFR
ncbi:transglycosylase domain-containing protein [Prosthecobacter dejongeii]|uniref:Penicillin-binding protein 1A n=1 Tax=Prosthecobacter dejongeii TaxID=48465 RepID=A0A7W7YIY1_9BACT|nr:PBP1A family penicillin-binding protein [Prosthecobacter dejongeii]MBB5036897.1 penicillin-binding protein 1A [Prosthecobacter dejongeii]